MHPTDSPTKDNNGIVVAVILIAVAIIALWDTTTMVDSDSYVFPRAIAIAMMGLSLLFIVWQYLRPNQHSNQDSKTVASATLRRIVLVSTMLIGALLMPWVGFILSGIVIFGALMVAAMYDPWTKRRVLIYTLSGLAIVLLFYLLFANVLSVPLPLGSWFQ